ncbi:putative RNA-binding protein [Handroanthus impetiginosus]|uniref:Putative RNA-binding protein n=1 Tax=Handroanthus impetiginosus TaxID=429701 RepID=A0A2G9GIY4_9LAMI|nr:putative RNA-binding protein [Handroanthus impetiginosus]
MAQASLRDFGVRKIDESKYERENEMRRNNRSFKFNVAAPEFVPTLAHNPTQMPITGYFYPYFQYIDGTSGSWIYVSDQEITMPLVQTNNKANAEAEYMFSDMSMLANETLAKHVSKDPEGYVPINFVSTLKKLKSLNVNNQMVAQALRSSSKLVVSSDGKKVRRKNPFTEKEKEELQLRTVIAENLPDDHSHQKIEKMFNVVGSIKSIRICQPQEHNSLRSSKGDVVVSNKLHALVEYETPEAAEKAAEKLNDERNWRKGMRVRLMLKRSPKSVLKNRKSDFDMCFDDEGTNQQINDDASRLYISEASSSDDNSSKKTWVRNRGKPKHRPQLQGTRSLPTSLTGSCPGQPIKGPRMPDGTRGFTMGRGKPLTVPVQSS